MEREDLTKRIEELASVYTPEWKFSEEQPDFGSGLALLFAGLTEETYSDLSALSKSRRIHFFNCLGTEKKPGEAATGYMTFNLVKPDMPAAVVQKGTGVEGVAEDGGKVLFETLEEVAVSPACVAEKPYESEGMLYLKFSLPPKEPLLNLLAVVEREAGRNLRKLCWEYESCSGFLPLKIEDNTDQLTKTGLLRFTCPKGLVSGERFGQSGSFIRVRNLLNEDWSCGVSFYLNGASVRAVAGGVRGNLLPFSRLKLTKTVGFVSNIQNPDVLYGGTDPETEEEAVLRGGRSIKYRGQAVTPGDFEALVREASQNIERVKCFSGMNQEGESVPGFVTVAVLQKDYEKGRKYFHRLREELLFALQAAASACLFYGHRLEVTAPWFVLIRAEVCVATGDYDSVIGLQKKVEEALSSYLNPVTGGYGGEGWRFGGLPGHEQVKHMLQKVKTVSCVKKLSLSARLEAAGEVKEVSYEAVRHLPFALPLSDGAKVTVVVEQKL